MADESVLFLDLPDDRVGATDQRQAIVDPEIVGLGALPEDPPQLHTLWRPRFPHGRAIRPVLDASPRQHLLASGAERGVRHPRRSEMVRSLFPRLLVCLRHMHMARQEGTQHGAGVTTLLPELAPGSEFLGNHRVNINVL